MRHKFSTVNFKSCILICNFFSFIWILAEKVEYTRTNTNCRTQLEFCRGCLIFSNSTLGTLFCLELLFICDKNCTKDSKIIYNPRFLSFLFFRLIQPLYSPFIVQIALSGGDSRTYQKFIFEPRLPLEIPGLLKILSNCRSFIPRSELH